ncbi:MAG: dihydrofolate reductase [Gammaproteobacteria bacterium]|nr:dihydrofolate reductase [Gammaproteobacteria bacterium]
MKPLANLSIIAAMSDNQVIGRDNKLPWRMPADLAHFKRITMGKPIIMGRRTWESLPGLLPHRIHVVLTRDRDYVAEGATVVHSIAEAIELFGDADEMLVVGGANVYAQTLPLASTIYLTLIHRTIDGDTRFPDFEVGEWHEVSRTRHACDERNPHDYSFVVMRRV